MQGVILFLETAEDIPEHWIIEYLLIGMGERGWLDKFQAVLVGRPKAWEFDKQNSPEARKNYREQQRQTIIDTIRKYNQHIPIIQNMDFGHTDPQIIVPMGKQAFVDSAKRTVIFEY